MVAKAKRKKKPSDIGRIQPPLKEREGRSSKLTPQMVALIDAYFGPAKFNKFQALAMAGYSTPEGNYRVFNHPGVSAEIERRHAEIRVKYEVTYERVVDELATIAFSNIDSFMAYDKQTGEFVGFDLSKANLREISALGEITVDTYTEGKGEDAQEVKRVRLKPHNKLSALDALMRHAGLSKEKQPTVQVELIDRIRKGRARVGVKEEEEEEEGE